VPITAAGLKTLGEALDRPIYWAGPRPDRQYELTKTDDGRVWIRYLPKDATIGEQETPYLTVGTYPMADAFAVTSAAAGEQGAVRIDAGNGAVAFYNTARPTSMYLAYPGSDYQIEVFDPSGAKARNLVEAQQVVLVPGVSSPNNAGATALRESDLRQLAKTASGPIYWNGPKAGVTYEVTQSQNGRIFLRYLPTGDAPGTDKQLLTIGTYPVPDAFAVTKQAASGAGAVVVKTTDGSIAFYNESTPTNVYLAYPGKDYQIEVFDPNARVAQQIVASGQVQPVS